MSTHLYIAMSLGPLLIVREALLGREEYVCVLLAFPKFILHCPFLNCHEGLTANPNDVSVCHYL